MQSIVALVETHPATVEDDYRRVLDLAGVAGHLAGWPVKVLLAADGDGFLPGHGATPWQLASTLAWLQDQTPQTEVMAVGAAGTGPVPAVALWTDTLTRFQAVSASAESLRSHRHISSILHPALDEILPSGVELPVGLAGSAALLLTAPTLRPHWLVAGAVSCLAAVVTKGAASSGKPVAEVTAEALAEMLDLVPRTAVVLDGTLWGVPGRQGCVARQVLLAGTDPLAVDAVALRLAGVDPLRVPWVRQCVDHGCGQASAMGVRVVGRLDLLDLDFDLRADTFAGQGTMSAGRAGAVWRNWGQNRPGRRRGVQLSGTPWDTLLQGRG